VTDKESSSAGRAATMRAIRLRAPGGPEQLVLEQIESPRLRPGEALVRVHAAAITRDELEWPVDRLPAIPSYELSGVVAAVARDVRGVTVGEPVYALIPFDRDGAAADFVAVPASVLAPKPRTLDHVESAAVPLAALSAWQGLFDHGGLEADERVLIHGAAGGVGHFAVQLARRHGAYVIGTASHVNAERARTFGAHEVLEAARFEEGLDLVDLVFDTVGGDLLARSAAIVRRGGRLVSVAEEPAQGTIDARYFVVEPNREQLVELARLAEEGDLRPEIDSVFPLTEARAAFFRNMTRGKRGKVVLRVFESP
jgi:NADPH:quinone reductase-like Zn-dependent oxidoreductase